MTIPTSRPSDSPDPYVAARAETARLTVPMKEVAAALNFSLSLCYELARRGTLPIPATQQPGTNRWLILRADFNRYFGLQSAPTPLSIVSPTRSECDMALAAIDRRLSDHENEIALLRWQRAQIAAETTDRHLA